MSTSPADTLILIVRIWQEPRETPGAAPIWRAVIEKVPSGQRRYVDLRVPHTPGSETAGPTSGATPPTVPVLSLAPLCNQITGFLEEYIKEDEP